MRSHAVLVVAALAGLTGCTVVEGGPPLDPVYLDRSVPDPRYAPRFIRPEPTGTCESYADQTYRNTYEDLSDPRDGFGADRFAQRRAERAGDRAYERCRAGVRG